MATSDRIPSDQNGGTPLYFCPSGIPEDQARCSPIGVGVGVPPWEEPHSEPDSGEAAGSDGGCPPLYSCIIGTQKEIPKEIPVLARRD